MSRLGIEYGCADGQPWAALVKQSRTGDLKWRWDVYGVAFTPYPEFTHDSAVLSAIHARRTRR